MEYSGTSSEVRVRIVAESGWLAKYSGQECDATLYGNGILPQIDSEQLTPPIPRWQSVEAADIQVIEGGAQHKEKP